MENINGLTGSSAAYFISKHYDKAHVVLPNLHSNADFVEALRYFYRDKAKILVFPEYTRFYEPLREDPQILWDRLSCLKALETIKTQDVVLVSSVLSLSQKTVSPKHLHDRAVYLMKSMELDRDELVESLRTIGYVQDDFAQDRGFFSVRGFLIDLVSAFDSTAYRIEFFGDEVASIRRFDPQTQRSLHEIQELELWPCRDFVFSKKEKDLVRKKLKDLGDQQGVAREERELLWSQIENYREIIGSRWLTPASSDLCRFDEFIPRSLPLVSVDEDLATKDLRHQMKYDAESFELLESLAYPPSVLQCDPLDFLNSQPKQKIDRLISSNGITYQTEDFSQLRPKLLRARSFDPLLEEIERQQKKDRKTRLVLRNPKRAETLRESLGDRVFGLEWDEGPVFSGFSCQQMSVAFLNEKDIFGVKRRHVSSRSVGASEFLREFSDLQEGDFIVHEEHGLGLYRGLTQLEIGDIKSEFALIEYADEDRLYLPIYRLDQLSRFVSGDTASKPKLDRLGSTSFLKKKSKAKKDILRIAHELMEIAAHRKIKSLDRPPINEDSYQAFCQAFPYELTEDQEKSIRQLEEDLVQGPPMDRLICGDVGFGKTEVAIRAAYFRALQAVQVAILCPTTLLTEQHYRSFESRFRGTGKTVARLSRFMSKKEQQECLQALSEGLVDVVIGTHRLLSKDVSFKNLGMLIVDEEQRFGVKHKEAIKKMRAEVDLISLSATPIPRTLQMSIVGIRDLSLITTPPDSREAVATHVGNFDPNLIRQACERERDRGGQILFVHNRVQSILNVKEKLEKIIPGFSVAVAHGQMKEEELEKIMMDYVAQKYDVLLATSIIESGLDIPNANTIFVDHAEQFGLSDLYQLRGRVGRGHRKAYSYFLIHEENPLTDEASKRLQVIQNCTELGSGFRVATHDLEIRGSGNILGEAQSGLISEVGLELYNQMLEETLQELRREEPKEPLPEINSGYTGFLPDWYIPDPSVRISTYRQINRLASTHDLLQAEEELKDRFGPFPQEVANLLSITQIRIYAHLFKASGIDCFPGRISMRLKDSTPLSVDQLKALLSKKLQIDASGKLTHLFDSALNQESLFDPSKYRVPEEQDFAKIRSYFKRLAEASHIRAL